jgi:hypothetical protein
MYLEHIRHILPLNISQDVDEPLKVTMGGTDP